MVNKKLEKKGDVVPEEEEEEDELLCDVQDVLQDYEDSQQPCTTENIVERLGVSLEVTKQALADLKQMNIVRNVQGYTSVKSYFWFLVPEEIRG